MYCITIPALWFVYKSWYLISFTEAQKYGPGVEKRNNPFTLSAEKFWDISLS